MLDFQCRFRLTSHRLRPKARLDKEAVIVDDPIAIILAAGQGTRMDSDLPKVVHKVCGRPMVEVPVAEDARNRVPIETGLQIAGDPVPEATVLAAGSRTEAEQDLSDPIGNFARLAFRPARTAVEVSEPVHCALDGLRAL